jgi:hypothetical protein
VGPRAGRVAPGLHSFFGTFRERSGENAERGWRAHVFTFPENARWDAERPAVEFGVEIGEYQGVVRVPRRVFQRLLPEGPTPERCVEAYYLQRRASRASLSGSFDGAN